VNPKTCYSPLFILDEAVGVGSEVWDVIPTFATTVYSEVSPRPTSEPIESVEDMVDAHLPSSRLKGFLPGI
jgi:hypothetical protein